MPLLLSARDLHKGYIAGHGRCWARVQVLSALSLSVARGERVVIVGARGSGKTTLLHCLTGLRRLDAGSVRWDASRGAPYQLCGSPHDLVNGSRESAILAELPGESRSAADWLDALHHRHALGATWLVLATRAAPLAALAHRVLELREGALHETLRRPLRVAEGR